MTPPVRMILEWLDEWQDICRETAAFVATASRVDASTVAAQSLDRVRNRIVKELGRQQSDQATRLQQQVTKTLKGQFAEASSRILDTETRLTETLHRRQEEHAVALQKELKAGLQAQTTETGRRLAKGPPSSWRVTPPVQIKWQDILP